MTIPSSSSFQHKLSLPHTPPNSSPPQSTLLLSSSTNNVLEPGLRIDQLKHSFQSLSSQQQEWLLSEIVNQCDHTHLSFLHDMITPRLKVDFLKRLPLEISLYILSFINHPQSLGQIACVSKHWNQLLKDETIWKTVYEQHYNHFNNSSSLIPQQNISDFSYRDQFIRRYRISTAWKHGGHVKVVDEGLEGLVTSLQCDDKYIVVGCDNHRIEVFDTSTGNKIRTLLGHEGGVWALQFKGDDLPDHHQLQQRILVSAGCDRDVRVWNLETGELLHTLHGHISTVRCLKMKNKQLAVTGSRDCTLRIWDIENGRAKHVLYGHQGSVRCLDISGNVLVSGSYDHTARVWDLTTGECIHVLEGHQSFIYSIVTDGIKVAAGSLATHIRVWSVETGECLATLHGHTSLVGQLELVPGYDSMGPTLVSGGTDGCLRVWDWNEPFECLQRISAHDSSITCLQCDDQWIVSAGSDGRVKLWDRKEGRLIRTLANPAKTVWKTQFNQSKAILLMYRALNSNTDLGTTVLEIHDFDI
ncbi:WD40-repeat-containing domain protein [Halteromyces radiatus]|uniref:WD40-repeat-containing domain protein n=1 Tax=Halteromyces radiatus TaxID=101107 RepID=UPI002220FA7D|nr:WD40-repeat-containing domain protein [Halteromyces radiatus]KAI8097259.1 WD40-repeat-containing domain protein [Halteromyces radiatus]